MKKTFWKCAFILMLPALFCLSSCRKLDESQGSLVDFGICKTFPAGLQDYGNEAGDPSLECLGYTYSEDQTLDLVHVNAGFNCCPGNITADISVAGTTITIVESEQQAGCHCNCLFDVRYRISNLPPGSYRIRIVSPYQPAGEAQLEAVVDLSLPGTQTICVSRSSYPWQSE